MPQICHYKYLIEAANALSREIDASETHPSLKLWSFNAVCDILAREGLTVSDHVVYPRNW